MCWKPTDFVLLVVAVGTIDVDVFGGGGVKAPTWADEATNATVMRDLVTNMVQIGGCELCDMMEDARANEPLTVESNIAYWNRPHNLGQDKARLRRR